MQMTERSSGLAENLEPGRAALRGEIEKLALFVAPGGRVTLDAAEAAVGGRAGNAGSDGLLAAIARRVERRPTGQ